MALQFRKARCTLFEPNQNTYLNNNDSNLLECWSSLKQHPSSVPKTGTGSRRRGQGRFIPVLVSFADQCLSCRQPDNCSTLGVTSAQPKWPESYISKLKIHFRDFNGPEILHVLIQKCWLQCPLPFLGLYNMRLRCYIQKGTAAAYLAQLMWEVFVVAVTRL